MSTLEIAVLFVFYEQQVSASAQCSVLSEQCSAHSASLRHGLTAHLPSAGINAADELADADAASAITTVAAAATAAADEDDATATATATAAATTTTTTYYLVNYQLLTTNY